MNKKRSYAELGIPVFIFVVSAWYLFDAYKAESSIENLLLILPVSLVALCLSIWIFISQFPVARKEMEIIEEKKETKEEKKKTKEVSVLGAMIILAAYIISMDWIGFDVATFLFILALMFLQGERRVFVLISFSLIFALLTSLFFEYMIPYPMPMLLGREFLGGLL